MRIQSITLAAVTVLTALAALSGCRVQNKTTTELSGYDVVSGYYSTGLVSIEASVRLRDEAGPRKKTVGTAFAQPTYLATLTDPVLLYVDYPLEKRGSLRSSADPSVGLPIGVDFDRRTIHTDSLGEKTIDDCLIRESVTNDGSISNAPIEAGGYPLKGRLAATFSLGYAFSGMDAADGCIAPLAEFFEGCYIDARKCSEGDAEFIHNVFDRSVNAGLIDATDIHRVDWVNVSMRYE